MKSVILFGLSLLMLLVVSSCGTVINGTTQSMMLNSTPNGAKVTINGFFVGTTPCTIKAERQSSNAIIIFDKAGFKPYTTVSESKISGWFWANALWGYPCVFSSTTDAVKKGMYEYDRDSFFANLEPFDIAAKADIKKATQIKKFVLTRYAHIVRDVSTGGGENAKALKELLGYSDVEQKAYLQILKNSIELSNDADELAEILIKKAQ